jgi:hypothetical protein
MKDSESKKKSDSNQSEKVLHMMAKGATVTELRKLLRKKEKAKEHLESSLSFTTVAIKVIQTELTSRKTYK